ncbi:MAG: hypothetical protein JW940_08160 [Polyangiaceae bacterium]|nr:hypothetical protein [Polyangiaceae bacterium]
MRRTCRRFALVLALTGWAQGCGSAGEGATDSGTGGLVATGGASSGGARTHSGGQPGGSRSASAGSASSAGSAASQPGSAGTEAVAGAAGSGNECDAQLVRDAKAVGVAVDALTALLGQLNQSVAVACANMATDLGAVPAGAGGAPSTGGDLAEECDAARKALSSEHASFVVEGGVCAVDFSAQVDCETACSNGACADDALDRRCPAGSYMAECARCEPDSSCLGSSEVPAQCTGTCSGLCDGSCDGDCDLKQGSNADVCHGLCNGDCDGTCTGSCLLASEKACGDAVLCQGSCAKEAGEGSCSVVPLRPDCEMSDDCVAACGALAALRVQCVAPAVVVLRATADQIAAPVEAHLPALLSAEQGPGGIAVDALAEFGLAELADETAQAIADDPACLVMFGQTFVDKLHSATKSEEGVAAAVKAASAVHAAVETDS